MMCVCLPNLSLSLSLCSRLFGCSCTNSDNSPKLDRHQMVITLPPTFDEESTQITRKDEYALVLSIKERIKPLRRRLASVD
jgi:hypothetical protein